MEKLRFSNGVKLIYEQRAGSIASFCIGFNAGALEEDGFNYGIAHAVEHMVFKGTKTLSEFEINKQCDEVFGFHNAMTNYPYAIYYGTTHSEDFEKGFEIYRDILLNPIFPTEGFAEEMSIISEELTEWSEDLSQHCEDLMLANAFNKRRIKELIIGNERSVNNITMEEIKEFYGRFYCPENCVISVVSSLSREAVLKVVSKYFGRWEKPFKGIKPTVYEVNSLGVYTGKEGRGAAKIKYCFPIHTLEERELSMLAVFNSIFGEGVSSILFDEIRTRNGLAYEVFSEIRAERGIKLFVIYVSTSPSNVDRVLNLIDTKLEEVRKSDSFYSEAVLRSALKRLRLRRELAIEKSVELSKRLTTYELMYEDALEVYNEYSYAENITACEIRSIINKVLKNPTVFVLR